MNKEKIEKVFRNVGVFPAARETYKNYEIFYGDGFSRAPHKVWQDNGALEPGDFPNGAQVVFYWVGKDERLLAGRPLFFSPLYSQDLKIKEARQDARKFINAYEKKQKAH